jgi:uncharacterized protein (TIGR02270 family)
MLLHRLYDDDPGVSASAFRATAQLGRADLLPMALHARTDRDPARSVPAAWAAARLGDRSDLTLEVLTLAATNAGPGQERAVDLAVRCLTPAAALAWVRKLWKDPLHLRPAVVAAGALGDPALAGVAIEWMGIEAVARAAGEAFSMITGADLRYLDLDRDPPEHLQEDGSSSDDDGFEALAADRDLPYPDQEKVSAWWRVNRDRFAPGRRYLAGSAIERDALRSVLVRGKQRQRAAAALELALLEPSEPWFDVRARGDLQEKRLQVWTS